MQWGKVSCRKRSSHPEVLCEKGVLRNFGNFTGKHLCESPSFKRCFPVNFGKFQRSPFLAERFRWMLLQKGPRYFWVFTCLRQNFWRPSCSSKLAKFGQITICDMNRVFLLFPKRRNILFIEMDTRHSANEHIFQTKSLSPGSLPVVQNLQNLVRRLFVT